MLKTRRRHSNRVSPDVISKEARILKSGRRDPRRRKKGSRRSQEVEYSKLVIRFNVKRCRGWYFGSQACRIL